MTRSVAGLDLLTIREKDADHVARHVAGALCAQGAEQITVASHRAIIGTLRHVTLTIGATALEPDRFAATLAEVVQRAGTPFGLSVDGAFRGEPELRAVVDGSLGEQQQRRSGRVVIFPGSSGLVGTVCVGRAVRESSIDRVQVLAGGSCDEGTLLITRDFVRPRWQFGELVLHVQPAAGGTVVPFETPDPTACCADHAGDGVPV